ncbi:cadherin-like beta sandwich domain-containing protein [[Clostridium] innocuum]|nr:cadherin-like beta sandwich domain-containing protein [[Clostridium] innocuum]
MDIKKLCIGGVATFLILELIPIKASSVAPGEGFSVSVSCGNVEGTVNASANNATITSAGNWCERGGVIEVSAVAGGAGTATITITGIDATGNANTANPVDYSGVAIGSTSVNVVAPSNNIPSQNQQSNNNEQQTEEKKPEEKKQEEKKLSSNANLASLSISQGTLSPKFSASKTQYTVNLNGDVSSIKVNATAADSKAVVYGTGTKSLKPGKNTISVSVAAEDGSTKEYTITVNVDETPLVYVSYNGAKLGFVRSLDGVDKPAKSFEAVKIKVDGKEVKAWKSNLLKKTVVYLQDDKTKEKNYYIYNTDTNTVETMLRPMALLGNNVFVVDVPKNLQTREGMNFTTVKIDNYELNGWTFKDTAFENYALIYVMDEKGNMVYYQYEATEKTLQLYSGAATIPQSAYDQYRKDVDASLKKHKWVIYGLAGGCVVLAGLSAVIFFRRKKTVKYQKRTISDSRRDAEADALRNISDDN